MIKKFNRREINNNYPLPATEARRHCILNKSMDALISPKLQEPGN